MSKFKDEIADKLFKHLDENLSYEVKSILTPTLISEVVFHSADFMAVARFNDIFDQAMALHKALLESQKEEESEEEAGSFMSDLKKL